MANTTTTTTARRGRRTMGRSSLSAHPPKAVDVWPAEVEAPKNVVDYGQLEKQDDCVYFESAPFTGLL